MMRSLPIAIVFFGFLSVAQAQSDFVATSVGDTIYGKIGFNAPEEINESITIKNDEGKLTINSNRIVYIQSKGKTYRSIRYGNKYRLMQEIVPGYLSLLKYRDGGFEFATNFLYMVTGKGIATSPITFRRTVSEFLQECEVLSAAILEKKYGYRDINEVVKQYNQTCLREVSQESAPTVDLKELQSLLSDIISRQEKNESVPDYLKKALREYADKDIRAAIVELLETLEK